MSFDAVESSVYWKIWRQLATGARLALGAAARLIAPGTRTDFWLMYRVAKSSSGLSDVFASLRSGGLVFLLSWQDIRQRYRTFLGHSGSRSAMPC
jgi:hypothetical protein